MSRDPLGLVAPSELRLLSAKDNHVRKDDSERSFGVVARDFYEISDPFRELLSPALRGGPSATHKAAANTAYVRALLIEAAIERRGGDLDLYVDRVQVRDPNGRIVPPQQSPEAMGEWEGVAPVPFAAPEEPAKQHDARTTDRGFRP
jgi:hypothetical protein